MLEQTTAQITTALDALMPYLEFLIIAIIFIVLSRLILIRIRRKLIKNAKSKRQISDIKIFSRIFNMIVLIIVIFVAFFSYIGSWSGLGIFAGLLTAGLGFALQKPITGIAAWFMVIVKRPFYIGDRIKIGDTKGDVYDITLSHVYIDETGGIADSEDYSGRNVMIPNYKLFEMDIINYTLLHEMVLGEINLLVHFRSNLDKIIKIAQNAADKYAKEYADQIKKNNKVRISFKDNGMNVKVLFYSPITKISGVKSEISKEIYHSIKKQKDIDFTTIEAKEILHE